VEKKGYVREDRLGDVAGSGSMVVRVMGGWMGWVGWIG
jgi:hypothetical protein